MRLIQQCRNKEREIFLLGCSGCSLGQPTKTSSKTCRALSSCVWRTAKGLLRNLNFRTSESEELAIPSWRAFERQKRFFCRFFFEPSWSKIVDKIFLFPFPVSYLCFSLLPFVYMFVFINFSFAKVLLSDSLCWQYLADSGCHRPHSAPWWWVGKFIWFANFWVSKLNGDRRRDLNSGLWSSTLDQWSCARQIWGQMEAYWLALPSRVTPPKEKPFTGSSMKIHQKRFPNPGHRNPDEKPVI